MRFVVVVTVILLGSQRAHACPDADLIPDWVGYPIAGGIIGGYAYGTGYFIDHDLADDRRDRDYIVGDLTFNGMMGTIFGVATVDAISHERASAVPLAALTLLHGGLAVHAATRIDVGSPHASSTLVTWGAGSVYVIETLAFVEGTASDHGRGYGLVEAGVQTPIAAGFAYLAYDRARASSPAAIVYGGMALVSGALAYHGMKTAVSPYVEPKLDLLGTDVMPTLVDDGHDVGPGIAAARTW
jgi:hypothetical protein